MNLTSIFTLVRSIYGNVVETLGYVTLTHEVNNHVVTSRFYVMHVGTIEENLVLGRTLCYQVKSIGNKENTYFDK